MNESSDASILVAIAVVEHEGRFLVGQRPDGVPLAGYWEFPGGKIRSGESPREAAVRECSEETSLDVVLEGDCLEVVHCYEHGQLRLHFCFGHVIDPAATPKPPFRWVERTELASLQFPDANRRVIKQLVAQGKLL